MNVEQVTRNGIDYIPGTIGRLRAAFDSRITRTLAFRQQQLGALARFLEERESEIEDALHQDLGRARQETFTAEIALGTAEIRRTLKHLPAWMRPEKVPTCLAAQPGISRIVR